MLEDVRVNNRYLCFRTRHKVITRSPSVRNERVKVSLRIKDYPVRPGRSARIGVVARQNREFVPRRRSREAEALVVMVLVRVATYI